MDADVQGAFPSKFTLNIFQPPPPAVMMEVPAEESDGSPLPLFYAVGDVVAAHAAFPVGLSHTEHEVPSADGQSLLTTECLPNDECFVTESTCLPDVSVSDCTITPDPLAPKRFGFDWVAGVSDVIIAYLSRDIDQSTEKGRNIVKDIGVSTKGYHLLQVVPLSEKEEALALECTGQAWKNVEAQYERDQGHPYDGTDLPEEEVAAFRNAVEEEERRLSCLEETMVEVPSGEPIVVNMYQPDEL